MSYEGVSLSTQAQLARATNDALTLLRRVRHKYSPDSDVARAIHEQAEATLNDALELYRRDVAEAVRREVTEP